MKVGFTGTRMGMSERQKLALRGVLAGAAELHHGDCIGADAEADGIAREFGLTVVIHPPANPSKRAFCHRAGDEIRPPADYLVRNAQIVDSTDCLVAAPHSDNEEQRSGTWATVRYARRCGRVIRVLGR